MTGRLENRVVKLERGAQSGWRAWDGRPVDEWPDKALLASLAEDDDALPRGYWRSTWKAPRRVR